MAWGNTFNHALAKRQERGVALDRCENTKNEITKPTTMALMEQSCVDLSVSAGINRKERNVIYLEYGTVCSKEAGKMGKIPYS